MAGRAQVEKPVAGAEAFRRPDDAGLLSQAGFLLLTGRQLRGDEMPLRERALSLNRQAFVDPMPEEDAAALGVPRLSRTAEVFESQPIEFRLTRRYGKQLFEQKDAAFFSEACADMAERFTKEPTAPAAGELLAACLYHPADVVRVAAAAASLDLHADALRLQAILAAGSQSEDALVRDLAATALAQASPDHAQLLRLTQKAGGAAGGAASHTTLLVHGTWARNASWWQSGGDFHSYLTPVLPALPRVPPWSPPYAASDRFEWSGGYSDAARALAASDLVAWANSHGAQGMDLMGHSHGANVAMLATHSGLQARELVLLSCPVHVDKYMPDFSQVSQVVSIRVRLDLVILADRGGQRFRHPQISENVLPLWFDHSASRTPAVWQSHNVPSRL
jgi:hypothetical protein